MRTEWNPPAKSLLLTLPKLWWPRGKTYFVRTSVNESCSPWKGKIWPWLVPSCMMNSSIKVHPHRVSGESERDIQLEVSPSLPLSFSLFFFFKSPCLFPSLFWKHPEVNHTSRWGQSKIQRRISSQQQSTSNDSSHLLSGSHVSFKATNHHQWKNATTGLTRKKLSTAV